MDGNSGDPNTPLPIFRILCSITNISDELDN